MKDKRILEEICQEDGCTKEDCFLKRMTFRISHISDRDILQIKLVDKLKYEWSSQENRDIGFTEAMMRWVNLGYAKEYAKIWDKYPNYSLNQIYQELNNYVK